MRAVVGGLVLVLGPAVAAAQETETLLDNSFVTAVRLTYAPGETGPEHTHEFPRTVYVESGGVVVLTGEDGQSNRVTLATGALIWRPAETHSVANVGDTMVVLVETEIRSQSRSDDQGD